MKIKQKINYIRKAQICFNAFLVIFLISAKLGKANEIDNLLKQYPSTYQDIVIHNKVVQTGTNICPPRYEMIRFILDQYKGYFNVLDIGAAQGYFSFKIAYDYPKSSCIMIDTDVMPNSIGLLEKLCNLNNLKTTFFLKKKLILDDFYFLENTEHFDVILAFLVIHQMDKSQITKIFNLLVNLTDNLLIEVPNEAGVSKNEYLTSIELENLIKKRNYMYLGEFRRAYDPKQLGTGKIYWVKTKELTENELNQFNQKTISQKTFSRLNGCYP